MPDGISPQPSARHLAALAYATAGWAVLPCKPGGKEPLVAAVPHGFQDATADAETVAGWWSRYPEANIGVVPGSAGMTVIDIDPPLGDATWATLVSAHGEPETYAVHTPSGGRHLYFRGTIPGQPQLGPGIDTRCAAGYVLAPPSIVDGKTYHAVGTAGEAVECGYALAAIGVADLPEWAITAPPERSADAIGDLDWQKPANSPRSPIDEAYFHMVLNEAGDRSAIAARVINRCMLSGYSPEETYEVLAAYRDRPVMGHYGRANGALDEGRLRGDIARLWQKPNPNEADPWAGATFAEWLRTLGGQQWVERAPRPPRPDYMTAAELAATEFPHENDLWDRLVLRRLVNPLYGDGGVGKTILAQHLAVAVAAGLPDLFGYRVVQMPVLMVLCEDDFDRVKASMAAITAHLGVNLAELPITFYCRPEAPLMAVIGDRGELRPEPFLKTLCERIEAIGECLLVLDTLSDIAELNENLRLPPNTLFKKVLQPICDSLGATILLTAHPSEKQLQSGRGGSGSTQFRNAVRNRLLLSVAVKDREPQPGDTRCLRTNKSNYGGGATLYLDLAGPVFQRAESPVEREREDHAADALPLYQIFLAGKHHTLDSGLTTFELATELRGPRWPEEDDNEFARRLREANALLKNGASERTKRQPKFAGLFALDYRGDGATLPRPVRRWFAPREQCAEFIEAHPAPGEDGSPF